ncbi:uncharacterized protein PV09_05572 [Verruconis gallopava]|uniref:Ribosomal lysine N-methyltransferase 4 n=1 Tax=Verruconis gallopava TaxID=253628 RepID=A0A0D2AW30_9PEZI|nr:uncharacterized protein PV09_05572 [Verruconis gallopava]KIW03364.1 hypothetical protein PV09_05572 [Verruconis gallopava]
MQPSTMEVDDDFATKSAAFLSWLQASGATLSEKIELADLRHQNSGRGVVAKTDIESDEELFSIPRVLLLNTKNSDLATQHPDILKTVEGQPWLELIFTLLYENGKSDSKWRPYLNILPAQDQFDTLMYWDESELKELEASAVVYKIGKDSADKTFREYIWPKVQAQPSLFGFYDNVHEEEVLQAAHRMGTLIMAYAFDIESEREREIDEEGYVSEEEEEDMPKAMVPLADMLNADADRNNARLFYESDALVMKAIKPIASGEEIFNDYGPLPRSDLLRRYGYITDNYAQYDVTEIPSIMIVDVSKDQLKLDDAEVEQRTSLLELFDEATEEGYDIMRPGIEDDTLGIFPPSLKLLIALLVLPRSSLPPTVKPSKIEKLVARNEFPRSWYQVLLHVLEARLNQFPSSLEEDRQHLDVYKQRLQGGKWLTNQKETRRRFMALNVRVGEQEILQHAISVIKQRLKQEEAGEKRKADGPTSGSSTPKKTRR